MKRTLSIALLSLVVFATAADAARVRVVHKGPRGRTTRVTVRTTRPAPVVRVAPRVWVPAVTFGAVVVATLPPERAWRGSEVIDRDEGWTEFVMNVDRRGTKMYIEIERGAAQIDQATVVFDNGDAQVIEFADRVQRTGTYELIDFKSGRKVDHVRVIAKADTGKSEIVLHLV